VRTAAGYSISLTKRSDFKPSERPILIFPVHRINDAFVLFLDNIPFDFKGRSHLPFIDLEISVQQTYLFDFLIRSKVRSGPVNLSFHEMSDFFTIHQIADRLVRDIVKN